MQGASRPAAMRHLARTYEVTTEEGADTVRRDKMTEAQEEPTLWVTNKRRPRKVMWLGKLATLVLPLCVRRRRYTLVVLATDQAIGENNNTMLSAQSLQSCDEAQSKASSVLHPIFPLETSVSAITPCSHGVQSLSKDVTSQTR